MRFLVAFGRVAAVHVTNPEVRTRSGLGVGSTQDELVARLSAQLETRPSPYLPGVTETLFVPTDENDANQRIVFDVDSSGKTVGFRSGQLPEDLYGAACERPPAESTRGLRPTLLSLSRSASGAVGQRHGYSAQPPESHLRRPGSSHMASPKDRNR